MLISRLGIALVGAGVLAASCSSAPQESPPAPTTTQPIAPSAPVPAVDISYDQARLVIAAHRAELPKPLAGKSDAELRAEWPAWTSQHDADIRARLARGDEDSVVNFWMYGTSFTSAPRATPRDLQKLGGGASAVTLLERRLNDLVAGMASPGGNERLQFARQVVERHGIHLATPDGLDRARDFLIDIRERMVAENTSYERAAQSVRGLRDAAAQQHALATLFRERGLSSDTSMNADFALDAAIQALATSGKFAPGSVRRVAVIGPGLDFTNKAEGYDFYPLQTIQPFALADSLVRTGLATAADLRMTTFDLSPRVNQHLETARDRALQGTPYDLQLPLDADDSTHHWTPELVSYWQHFGERIGSSIQALAPPAPGLRVRAIRIPPDVMKYVAPRDLNIVIQRLAGSEPPAFDLVVATNILVYYDAFEQGLALANVASLLRPGGYFVTNYVVYPTPPMEARPSVTVPVFFDRQRNGDTLFCYARR